MHTFIIADNQDITRVGLQTLLIESSINCEVRIATNKKELISILQLCPTAAVILDYTLFDLQSLDEMNILTDRFPKAEWLLFSDDLSSEFIKLVLASQNRIGILMKDSALDEIKIALQYLSDGKRYICQSVSNMVIDAQSNLANQHKKKETNLLTPSEIAILKDIAWGKTTKEIANERNLSFHTINSHRKNIFRKLGINNVHEATKYAMRSGILDIAEYCI